MSIIIPVSLLFCEGLGTFLFHSYLPYILALIPCFLFILHTIYFNKFYISFSPSSLFLGCSTFLYMLSMLTSANKEASIEPILFFVSLFLLYLYFSSRPTKNSYISTFIYILCIIFIGGFLVYSIQKNSLSRFFIPQTEYQLISPFYNPHNHLGDFLGLGVVISFYYLITTSSLKYLIPIILFTPFILISFSNSAYLSIVVTSTVLFFLLFKKYGVKKKKVLIVFFVLTALSIVMFIGSTKGSERIPLFKPIQSFVTTTFSFYPKTLGSERLTYFSTAITGIKHNPFLGIGPHNFSHISKQLGILNDSFTTDVHNIFLEIGVEAGLPALICFFIFVILCIRRGITNPTLPFFLFLYLLFNFQTDYTYKIYSVYLLFIFCASQIDSHEAKNKSHIGIIAFTVGAVFLQLVIICLLTSLIFQKTGNSSKAVIANPFNRYAYYELLKEASIQGNATLVDKYTKKLHNISTVNTQSELAIADAYKTVGEPHKQFLALQNAYRLQPLLSPLHIEQLFTLALKYQSKVQAEQLIIAYISNRQKARYYVANKQTIEELRLLCKKTYERACEKIK